MSNKQLDPSVCNVTVAPGSAVCIEGDYVGEITFGAKCVVHPKARIIAEAGPIIIGESNLIEEQAQIINRFPPGSDTSRPHTLIIGQSNVFEVDCCVEADAVGDNNVFESKSHVGRGVTIGKGCVVGSLCSLTCPQVLSDHTVVYGSDHKRRQLQERPPAQSLQLDFLNKVLPNYHYLVKPKKRTPPSAAAVMSQSVTAEENARPVS
uniref:Dynactin subunit 6 n=1 Tax=Hirondellea gigas TaxID=1518452 RepID=A0A2P2HZE9_9CRUS